MSDTWELRVYEQQRLVWSASLSGAVELGRQATPEEVLYTPRPAAGCQRVVIASKDERATSRRQFLIEPQPDRSFRVTNLSETRPVTLPDGRELAPGASCAVPAEGLLMVGTKTIHLGSPATGVALQSLGEATLAPGRFAAGGALGGLALPGAQDASPRAWLRWLQATTDVLQSAAGSPDFFDKAARAVVELVKMDSAQILLLQQGRWKVVATHSASRRETEPPPASTSVLHKVRHEKRTFWEVPGSNLRASSSLFSVKAVVAAPILDAREEVIGALYGDRRGPEAGGRPITELDAGLVEVLARGVAAGLARMEQVEAALAAHVRFEQFFTPELARQLAHQPDLLEGRDTEVSILFCDVRGFSGTAERLGPARTMEWLGDVLGRLSHCVREHDGVLVDYIGDELMAMWGAPGEQPDHARRACRAALDMLAELPKLNADWQPLTGETMDLGIGVNTGPARVGNTGSYIKYKYGALGNTVNLASRVQGATKYLKCRALITGATKAAVDDEFCTRRLCQVKTINIAEPVTLYELAPAEQPLREEGRQVYEAALADFEAKEFSKAARALGNWRATCPEDEPALRLLYRAVQCMVEGPAPGHPVWVLPGK